MAGTPPTSEELVQMVRLGVQEGIAEGMKALAAARDGGPALGASHVLQAMATTLVATQEATIAPGRALLKQWLADRRYEDGPDDGVIDKRLLLLMTTRHFTAVEVMDLVMLWMGVGGRTPAHLTPEEDRGDALSKRRYWWAWRRATESDPIRLVADFNASVLEAYPEHQRVWEEVWVGLEYPILPFDLEDKKESVAVYNGELLAYAKGKKGLVTGAGPTTKGPRGFFKADGPSGGAPFLPHTVLPDGTPATDAAAVNAAITTRDQQLAATQAEVAALQKTVRALQKQLQQQQTAQPPQQQLPQQKRVCYNIRDYGKCVKGARCPFAHPPPKGGETAPAVNP